MVEPVYEPRSMGPEDGAPRPPPGAAAAKRLAEIAFVAGLFPLLIVLGVYLFGADEEFVSPGLGGAILLLSLLGMLTSVTVGIIALLIGQGHPSRSSGRPSAVLAFPIGLAQFVLAIAATLGGTTHRNPTVPSRTEIHSISIALDQYYNDFGTYPPSRVFCEPGVDAKGRYAWQMSWATGSDTMDGAECLVYFLNGPGFRGWSLDTKTFGPYLPDIQDRLLNVDKDRFPEIADPFRLGRAYLYFRADRSRVSGAEYNPADNGEIIDLSGKPGEPGRDKDGRFQQATTYQLICAGRDGRYFRAADGDEASSDDITNFGR